MIAALLATLLSQPLNLNAQPIKSLACDGGLVCSVSGSRATIINTVSGGGGGGSGGAPVDAGYVVWGTATSGSTNERVLTAGTNVTLDTTTPGQIIVNASGGGGGGSGNFVEVDIDFGTGDELLTTVVTGQAWVSGTSRIVCSPTMLSTSTRLEGEEDAVAEGLTLAVHSRVAGVGFSIAAAPRIGYAYGVFKIHCSGD